MEDTGQQDAAESKDPDDPSREDAEISEKEGMKAPASSGAAEDHAQAKSEAHDGEAMAAAGKDEGEPAKGQGKADKEEDEGGRVIYGKDLEKENDDIKYKWNAIFYKFTPEQKALMALDEVSLYSITDTRSAYNTSRIIQGFAGSRAVITDGCAAAGGNTMSFAELFSAVNAVELSKQRFDLLNHNLKALGYDKKVRTYHGNFLELMESLTQDVVFLDPPWGGTSYVEGDKLDLNLGGMPLAELCERLKPRCRFIALKLPLNFNLEGFRRLVTSSFARIDDRCARKQLFIVLDTSGREHQRSSNYKRDRDDGPAPWQLKRKSA